jgi:hypothetical protein
LPSTTLLVLLALARLLFVKCRAKPLPADDAHGTQPGSG